LTPEGLEGEGAAAPSGGHDGRFTTSDGCAMEKKKGTAKTSKGQIPGLKTNL